MGKEVVVRMTYRVLSLRNLLKDAVENVKKVKPVLISLPTEDDKIEKFADYSDPTMKESITDSYQLEDLVGIGLTGPSKYLR